MTSTHSDISHDRSRVNHMLAKSSHLLHRRQGGSLERNKEPSPLGLPRVSSDHACGALDAARQAQGLGDLSSSLSSSSSASSSAAAAVNGQSSRIVRYMQEVAMLAGVGEDSNPTPPPQPLTRASPARRATTAGGSCLPPRCSRPARPPALLLQEWEEVEVP